MQYNVGRKVRYKYFVLPRLRVYTAMHNMINTFSGFRAESLILSLPYTRTIYIIRTYTYYNMMYLPIYLMTDAFTTYALHRVEFILSYIHLAQIDVFDKLFQSSFKHVTRHYKIRTSGLTASSSPPSSPSPSPIVDRPPWNRHGISVAA